MRFEVERTRELFHQGLPLVGRVSPELRPQVELFVRGGLTVLRKIEGVGYNVWAQRPVVTKWEKTTLLAGALWRRVRPAVAVG
jgi:phytoene/squalene synthetase